MARYAADSGCRANRPGSSRQFRTQPATLRDNDQLKDGTSPSRARPAWRAAGLCASMPPDLFFRRAGRAGAPDLCRLPGTTAPPGVGNGHGKVGHRGNQAGLRPSRLGSRARCLGQGGWRREGKTACMRCRVGDTCGLLFARRSRAVNSRPQCAPRRAGKGSAAATAPGGLSRALMPWPCSLLRPVPRGSRRSRAGHGHRVWPR